MNEWLGTLSEHELTSMLPNAVKFLLSEHRGVDDLDYVAEAIATSVPELSGEKEPTTDSPRRFWQNVRAEVRLLVCSADPKYKAIRDDLSREKPVVTKVAIGMIAAAVGAALGYAAGLLTPFVLLCLIAMVKVGREAWCRLS